MPTSLARLFGRGRHRKSGDHGYSLRLAAALMEADEPWRVLAVACRLARRLQGCQIAVIGAWNDQEQPPVLDLVTGHRHRRDQRLFQEALAGRHSPLPALTDRPRWIKLSDDPFQPGASLLRRFDLEWALALPFVADLDGQARRCVMLLAGEGKSIDQHHPLVRDARLIWLAARGHLATRQARSAADPTLPWPGAEAWLQAPAALALVKAGRIVTANQAAVELLEASVGRDGHGWQTWLLGAVQRLETAGRTGEVVTASQSRGSQLAIRLGPPVEPDQPRLIGLWPAVAATDAEADDQESAMRMLGHELRTPLTAMQTSLDLVLRGDAGPLAADQERFLGTARRNLERLNRLLGDLLDAKRAEAGRLSVRTETVDLGAQLTAELEMLQVVCREKGIELDTSGVPDSFRACVDADKVQQMLHNVVGNAIKYTGQGGLVRVGLEDRLQATPGVGARLARRFGLPLDVFTLVVADSGMGMSEEFLEILFQPFRREDRAETRGLPGAGLGLHITRGLVEAHGGLIRLESRPGQGTTVWLVLPREPGSGRVLTAGRQIETQQERAATFGVPVVTAWLDARERLQMAQPWDAEAAARAVQGFLAGLGRDSRREEVQRFQQTAGDLCWQLSSGLWCGLVLDPARLDAAWHVATAAPECSQLLAGTRWQLCEEPVDSDEQPTADLEPVPVGQG